MARAFVFKLTPSTNDSIDSTGKLTPSQLSGLDQRIAANADRWLNDNLPQWKAKPQVDDSTKKATGRKPTVVDNPFFGFIGCTTVWGRYPVFALDIIEGVARMDWHDRSVDEGGKSMPLSVCNLATILESLPVVTNKRVMEFLQLGERHARRYVKALELIVPRLMAVRPMSLYREMEGIESEAGLSQWDDEDGIVMPSPEDLAKLHYDLRTLTQYKTAEEYDADEITGYAPVSKAIDMDKRQQHPRKHEVLSLIKEGVAVKAIERQTGVQPKTIRKWRDEVQLLAA